MGCLLFGHRQRSLRHHATMRDITHVNSDGDTLNTPRYVVTAVGSNTVNTKTFNIVMARKRIPLTWTRRGEHHYAIIASIADAAAATGLQNGLPSSMVPLRITVVLLSAESRRHVIYRVIAALMRWLFYAMSAIMKS